MHAIQTKDILYAVAVLMSGEYRGKYYQLTVNDLLSRSHKRRIAYPRMFAAYLIRKYLGFSFPKIGSILGRDHTSIIHGCALIREKYAKDRVLWDNIEVKVMELAGANARERQRRLEAATIDLPLPSTKIAANLGGSGASKA